MATLINVGLIVETPPSIRVDSEIHAARAQAAVLRSLLDTLDGALPVKGSKLRASHAAQTVEELATLAQKLLTIARSIVPQRA